MGIPISKKWKHMQTGPKCEPSYVGRRHDGTLYKKGDNQYLHAKLTYGEGWYKLKKK